MKTSRLIFRALTVSGGLLAGGLAKWASVEPVREKTAAATVGSGPARAAATSNQEELPMTKPIDLPHLTGLHGSSLLMEVLPVLSHFTAEHFRGFADGWVVLAQPGQVYDIEGANWALILRHWVERDSAGVESWLAGQTAAKFPAGSDAVKAAFQAYLKRHPEQALAWAARTSNESIIALAQSAEGVSTEAKMRHGIPLSNTEFAMEAARDPAGFVKELEKYKQQYGWGFSWNPHAELARIWGKKDPAAALAWANTLPTDQQAMAVDAIAESLNMEQLLELRAQRPASEHYGLGWTAVQRLRQSDPWAALRLVAQLFRGEEREKVVMRTLSDLADQQPERAMPIFRALGWPTGTQDVLLNLAKTEPAKAFAELAHSTSSHLSHPVFYEVIDWARTDYDAAMAWAQEMPLHLRKAAVEAVAGSLGHRPLDEIRSYAHSQPPGPVRDAAFSSLVSKLFDKDQPRAIQEISQVPADLRVDFATRYYWQLQEADKAGVLTTILQTAPITEENRERYTYLSTHLPTDMVGKLLPALPQAAVEPEAWRIVGERWSMEDPVQASAWTSQLPAGPGRDHAITGLVAGVLADGDVPAAWDWAATISEPAVRLPLLQKVYADWRQMDPSAASAALAADGRLSNEDRQQLSATISPQP